jgi:predicted polyphosphate/ATP-dependent NAD kinase
VSVSLERLARNQALYREVNERIVDLLESSPGSIDFLCECSHEECTELIAMTIAEYEEVRSQPTTFAVVPGHEIPAIEKVVATNTTFVVVDKINGRAAVASMARPRP